MSARGRIAAIVAGLLLTLGIGCSSSATETCAPLQIPNPLTVDYTAPAGTFCPGPTATVKGTVTADLSAADIVGSGTGYLFKPYAGSTFTLHAGNVSSMAGLVLGQVGNGQRATVTIDGGHLTGVVSAFLYKSNDGGRVDVTLEHVTATGLGAGVRTYGSAILLDNDLTGGGNPSSGEPAAARALDLNATATVVPDQVLIARGNRIAGFVGGNSDGLNGEETVELARIEDNDLADFGDAGIDLKVARAVVVGNTLHGTFGGHRLLAVHTGRTYSLGNSYAVPAGAAAIQATGTVSSDGDTFALADSSSLIAKATVACTGSTGFSGPRAGAVALYAPEWTPSDLVDPWRAVKGSCGGVDYLPTVTVDP